MSNKNLDNLFNLQRIAVIGVNEDGASIGYNVFRNLISNDLNGNVYPVNPSIRRVLGIKTYPSVTDIPYSLDLAMIATNPENLQSALKDCGEKGVKRITILAQDYTQGYTKVNFNEKILSTVETITIYF